MKTKEIKMKYKIVADASCDIPKEFLDKYDISIIPIEVMFGEEIYPEGLKNDEFYQKLNSTGLIPKTAMPNAYKFENFYKDYANVDDVFVITIVISMEMSTTKIQAQMAADNLEMKNVFIEESASTTVAQGAIIVELCRFIEQNKDATIDNIKEEFYKLRKNMRCYFVINDLKYLKQSGRLNSTSATIGSVLNVRPIVSIIDGKVTNIGKCIGNNKAESFILDKIKNVDEDKYFYFAHSGYEEGANKLIAKAKPLISPNQKITTGEIGCVVGSHVGAKCYGLGFFINE